MPEIRIPEIPDFWNAGIPDFHNSNCLVPGGCSFFRRGYQCYSGGSFRTLSWCRRFQGPQEMLYIFHCDDFSTLLSSFGTCENRPSCFHLGSSRSSTGTNMASLVVYLLLECARSLSVNTWVLTLLLMRLNRAADSVVAVQVNLFSWICSTHAYFVDGRYR